MPGTHVLDCFNTTAKEGSDLMNQDITFNERSVNEAMLAEKFLQASDEQVFTDLFHIFTPQLVAFYRARGCETTLAEDLAQEVMLIVHRKAEQLRDRRLFRAWLFQIARNALFRHFGKKTREVETVNLDDIGDRALTTSAKAGGTSAFEFQHWMSFLDSREREVMTLRFVEQWEYHEIAAAQAIPIGTVQWRVFNAKKKLAPHLVSRAA
jgi:RNA polymerase sigma-70 factor, ECF subfamily